MTDQTIHDLIFEIRRRLSVAMLENGNEKRKTLQLATELLNELEQKLNFRLPHDTGLDHV